MAFKLTQTLQDGVEPYQYEVEVGLATYTNDGTSVTVRTTLNRVLAGFVTLINDATIATDQKAFFSVPTGLVTSNAITISRSSHQAITDAAICYMLVGEKDGIL